MPTGGPLCQCGCGAWLGQCTRLSKHSYNCSAGPYRCLSCSLAQTLSVSRLMLDPEELQEYKFALAQLRHLYELMVTGCVKDTIEAAKGLLGPSIETLERTQNTLEGLK